MSSTSSEKQKDSSAIRVSQACNQCRQKKRRCDGKRPCSHCEKQNIECFYEAQQRRRGPGRSKEYIQSLKAQLRNAIGNGSGNQSCETSRSLKRVEAYISQRPDIVPGEVSSHIAAASLDQNPGGVSPSISNQTDSIMMDVFNLTSQEGHYSTPIGVSPQGIEKFSVLQQPGVPGESDRPPTIRSLISTDDIANLLEPVFDEMNIGYPFLSMSLFMESLSTLNPTTNVAWRALVDSIVAVGMILRPNNGDLTVSMKAARAMFDTTYSLLPQIIASEPDIFAIEALLAMAIFTKLCSNTRTTAQLIASVSCMLRVTFLQNAPPRSNILGLMDDRQRRAFWTAYILDVDISTQCGLPPTIDDDEFGVVPNRPIMKAYMQCMSKPLQIRIEVATMESVIYKLLYDRKAFKQTDNELVAKIVEIDWGLGYWPLTVPPEIRPDIDNPPAHTNIDLGVLMLHLTYFNCVNSVSWAARRYGSRSESAASDPSNPAEHLRVAASIEKSKKAARAILNLLRALSRRSFLDIWHVLSYLLSAVITLLVGILEDPLAEYARSDIWTIKSFRQFLEEMTQKGFDFDRILQGCSQIEMYAQDTVDKAESAAAITTQDPIAHNNISQLQEESIDVPMIKDLLSSCTHPIYVAHGLITGLRNCDSATNDILSETFRFSAPGNRQFGLFPPKYVHPGV
ncbi:hypothetical protein F5Y03DRAFT_36447 [Xylaria venustula]|nr:hypothetical protein F5Y03DRAFT_36447 [Xylaria venustula]